MNDNARKWVAALRSGEFEQFTGGYLMKTGDGAASYCCLGVACEIFNRETGSGAWEKMVVPAERLADLVEPGNPANPANPAFGAHDDFSRIRLPFPVKEWLGLKSVSGWFIGGELSAMNDEGKTFDEIAKMIESEPAKLFDTVRYPQPRHAAFE